MRDTKRVGDVAELRIQARLIELGWNVSVPVGDNCRYDMIGDNDGQLYKIQVKHGKYQNGCIKFHSQSHNIRTGKSEKYDEQIDYFAVYCSELNKCYTIPSVKITAIPHLRIDKPKNNQQKSITWVSDFEI